METLVSNVDNVKFDIELALEQQMGAQNLPFIGMDKSTAAICVFFVEGQCQKGAVCPFRHVRGDRTIVCKHWLRGLCKKGDQCEFLHEFDMAKMPECYFYTRFNACHNKECPFLHIDPESKVRPCPWYDRGFCRHGPHCRHRHVRKVLCLNYLAGFCSDGPDCKFVHASFELPQLEDMAKRDAKRAGIICHICGEMGHKSYHCPQKEELMPQEHQPYYQPFNHHRKQSVSEEAAPDENGQTAQSQQQNQKREQQGSRVSNNKSDQQQQPLTPHKPGTYMNTTGAPERPHYQAYQPYQFHPRPPYQPRGRGGRGGGRGRGIGIGRGAGDGAGETGEGENKGGEEGEGGLQPRRALEDVVCYKCGYKGHYANRCTKGHLAFLSHKAGQNPRGDAGVGGGGK